MSSNTELDARIRQLVAEMADLAPSPVISPSHASRRRLVSPGRVAVFTAVVAVAAVVLGVVLWPDGGGREIVETDRPPVPVTPVPAPSPAPETPTPPLPERDAAPATILNARGDVVLSLPAESADNDEAWMVAQIRTEIAALPELGATPEERLARLDADGLLVYVSLDPDVMGFAREVLEVRAEGQSVIAAGLDAAIVTVDNVTGEIVAAVSRSGQGLGTVQPAASARLATYAAALESGVTLDDVFDGTGPCTVDFGGTSYTIENFGNASGRDDTLRGLVLSASRCAQGRLEADLGINSVTAMLEALSGTERLSRLPQIVDPPRLTAVEHVSMMAAVSNEGVNRGLRLVTAVVDSDGNEIYVSPSTGGTRIISTQTAAQLLEVMEANVRGGTGTRARLELTPAGGLTGSIEHDFSAAWFVGTTGPRGYSTAIWVANQDGSPMVNTGGLGAVTGGSFPAAAWQQLHQTIEGSGNQPAPLIYDTQPLAAPPTVIACTGAPSPPPNRGGQISGGDSYPDSSTALEAFLSRSGVLEEPPLPQQMYLGLVHQDGSITYGHSATTVDDAGPSSFVTIITTEEHADGWQVVSWEASGC